MERFQELEELLSVSVPIPTLVSAMEPEIRLARVKELAETASVALIPPKVPVARAPLLVRKADEARESELARKLKPPRSSVPVPLSVMALAAGMAVAVPSFKVPPLTTVAPM